MQYAPVSADRSAKDRGKSKVKIIGFGAIANFSFLSPFFGFPFLVYA